MALTRDEALALDARDPLAAFRERFVIADEQRLYLDGKVSDEPRFRAHLEERAGVSLDDHALGRALFMTWDQARRMIDQAPPPPPAADDVEMQPGH